MTAEEVNNKIITFGCRLNAFESEAIKNAVKESGEKNLIVFNSCAVTSQAEKDLRSSIRKARRENPHAKIVVTGCAAQIDPQRYAKMAEIDLVLGNIEKSNAESYKSNFKLNKNSAKNINQNSEILHKDAIFDNHQKSKNNFISADEEAKIKVNDIMSVRDTAPQLVSYFENQTRAFLEIQNGCNHRCTFCIIPYGRGNSRSVPLGEIVKQSQKMVASGHKEIVLTGVDISDYGKDLPTPITLSQMIRRLLKAVPELHRLRLSSVDVAEIDKEFFEILANEQRLMPYLHLSVQSGDDKILKQMKRRHNRQNILDFCEKARKIRPEMTFGADIIAGFPTENDVMFKNSLSLISEADLIFTHIFPYSLREGTPASKMPQLEQKIIKERAKILREEGANQFQKYLQNQIGKEFEVLLEKNNLGKTRNFLDVEIISDKKNNLQKGNIFIVKINKIKNNLLIVEQ